MKKIFLLFLFACYLMPITYSQVKIINATEQKTFAGMGGVFVNYLIQFKSKTSVIL